MKWRQTLHFPGPLRDARLARPADARKTVDLEESIRAREQAAFARGVAEGEKRLSEQLLQQRAELLELQNGILTSLRQSASQVVRQSESALVELAFEVCRKLVCDLPISAEMVEAAIRAAVAQAGECTEFHIYLHSEDLAILQRCNSPVLLPGPGNESMHFHPSTEVTRGGCLVHTRFGVIDNRPETRVELLRHSLQA
jgi:flagellar assembly protein FliH